MKFGETTCVGKKVAEVEFLTQVRNNIRDLSCLCDLKWPFYSVWWMSYGLFENTACSTIKNILMLYGREQMRLKSIHLHMLFIISQEDFNSNLFV